MNTLHTLIVLVSGLWTSVIYAGENCTLSKDDLLANAKLSFHDYDQLSVLDSTARKLGDRACFAQAVESLENYMVFGPPRSNREQTILTWHMAQYLAFDGREQEAAKLAIASLRSREASDAPDNFDWNSYVIGTWGFLSKDRKMLDEAITRLTEAKGGRNLMNAKVLRSLSACFDRPYSEAYTNSQCQQIKKN